MQAIVNNAGLIVTYHPTPFSSMKRLTTADTAQRIMIECVRAGIAVYSPHTACDAADGGARDGGVAAVQPDQR